MKISVFYDHILKAAEQSGRSTAHIMEICRAAGISGLEMDYAKLAQDYDAVRAEIERANMRISSIYCFCDFDKNPDIEGAKRLIDTAAELGCKRVLIVPGFLTDADADTLNARASSYDATAEYMRVSMPVQNIRQALINLVEYAQNREVLVTLEDYDSENAPSARINQLLWFMRNVPGLRVTLDTGNFAYSDEDVLAAYLALRNYIAHVHCKDRQSEQGKESGKFNKGLTPVEVGGGYIPIMGVVELLKAQGYRGYLAIEHFGVEDQLSAMLKSAEFLKANS